MRLIFLIAARNLLKHKGKSLVIGLILFTGSLLLTIGNAVISGMGKGIEKNIINSFTGDIVIISSKQKSDNVLMGIMGTTIEPINDYEKIKPILEKEETVLKWLPVGKNLAMILNENDNTPAFVYLIGASIKDYAEMFPDNFNITEGHYPKNYSSAMLLPKFTRDELYNYTNTFFVSESSGLIKENLKKEALENINDLRISSSIVLMGMTSGINSTNDIRLPIDGIIKYHALDAIFGHFALIDIESFRKCLGYNTQADMSAYIPKDKKILLDMANEDLDSLFEENPLANSSLKQISQDKNISLQTNETAQGIYNLVFVKLKHGETFKKTINKINKEFLASDVKVRAVTWNKAAGPLGGMTLIIKSSLFIFVTLLFAVAIIIIVNTLTMSVIERSSELGMMRAIGAQKLFISGMFFSETAILSFLFGGMGVFLGAVIAKIIPLFKISTENDILQLLYGGIYFSPVLSFWDITLSFIQLCAVSIIAAIYPMVVALRITPLEAITRD